MADKLQITYHPAKKEIKFVRFNSKNNNIPVELLKEKYSIGERGKFILQDHGNAFFSDIAKTFDGQESIDIDFISPKTDYKDFLQMLEEYNKTPNKECNAQLNVNLLTELPDMKETFSIVEKHGKESSELLSERISKFTEFETNKDSVKKTIETIIESLQKQSENINTQIKGLSDNNVCLCFAGVYSAGKSSLINALLGYAILPEAIKSETAKMFKIISPKKGESIRIIFGIDKKYNSQLVWNDEKSLLEWETGPAENETKREIQEIINENKGLQRHEQICEVLRKINLLPTVDSEITIYFPIPLDDDKVQFTIYDTPGSDSNVTKHQVILKDALADQKKSILVLVAAPDKIEGEGNNALLTYIKEAEKNKDKNTCIDIGRSLFVMNKIETVKDQKQRRSLKTEELKNKEDCDFSIKLEDKKLLFVSAQFAYIAKALKNKLIDHDEDFDENKNKFFSKDRGKYYQLDQCGTSDFATKNLIDDADSEFETAEKNNDDIQKYIISSGLFSLEQEIKNYGIKYASAVRAYAIIKSVDNSLDVIKNRVLELENENDEELQRITQELQSVKNEFSSKVHGICNNYEPKDNKISAELIETLEISPEVFRKRVQIPAVETAGTYLKKWFLDLFGKAEFTKNQSNKIISEINELVIVYLNSFYDKRKKVLETQADNLVSDIKKAITANEKLSEKTKQILRNLRKPAIPNLNVPVAVKKIIDDNASEEFTKKKLCFDFDNFFYFEEETYREIDKDKFLSEELPKTLERIQNEIHIVCVEDFKNTMVGICKEISDCFDKNVETYSDSVRAQTEDRNTVEKLNGLLKDLEHDLCEKQNELNTKIWEPKNVER